jgi:hypothetical protein
VTYASLDHDDTASYGPETITIKPRSATGEFIPVIYTYWVHNYSGSPDFGVSNALVTIYKGGVQVAQYPVSAEPGACTTTLDLWRVFDLSIDAQGQMSIERDVRGFYDGDQSLVFCPGPGGPQSSCGDTLLFFDGFSDSNSGWLVGDFNDVALDYNNGNYRIKIKRDDWACWTSAPFRCANCSPQVEAWRSTGDESCYGIVFGMNSSSNQFYVFRIHPGRQKYSLYRRDGNTWVRLISSTYSSHINSGYSHNVLKVVRNGSQIKLYVNGYYLDSYTDSTYTGTRYVGVYAEGGSVSPVWLRYDDFTVWAVGEYGTASVITDESSSIGVAVAPSDPDQSEDPGDDGIDRLKERTGAARRPRQPAPHQLGQVLQLFFAVP